jgi:[ribosomal protein S18]-alanine N-acetyltransferase
MHVDVRIELARPGDARSIALLSREVIEAGLSWRWTPGRVLRSLADAGTNVIVARTAGRSALAGFALMKYGEQEAHLLLLAVPPGQRRQGVGSALLDWLHATALTAGTGVIRLETRASNAGARAFYGAHGYVELDRLRGYYDGVEDAVRLAKDLYAAP